MTETALISPLVCCERSTQLPARFTNKLCEPDTDVALTLSQGKISILSGLADAGVYIFQISPLKCVDGEVRGWSARLKTFSERFIRNSKYNSYDLCSKDTYIQSYE